MLNHEVYCNWSVIGFSLLFLLIMIYITYKIISIVKCKNIKILMIVIFIDIVILFVIVLTVVIEIVIDIVILFLIALLIIIVPVEQRTRSLPIN